MEGKFLSLCLIIGQYDTGSYICTGLCSMCLGGKNTKIPQETLQRHKK